ncbi:hypothetical protein JCM19241_5956 [Vibrio ishigakensis]|uniref:Lipoprotein n=1 Tax=Vibrio ishigakensis TaxID=1481914 RepID=A0A0B8QBL7_9VIBR|nr:hypothetical protein JCM19241_5956 [Vibrio ishigakensis]
MKKLLLTMATVSVLSGCVSLTPEQLADLRSKTKFIDENNPPAEYVIALDSLKSTLKDPDSMQIKHAYSYYNVHFEESYCVNYNAKNSYGGYVGYKWAMLEKSGEVKSTNTHQRICGSSLKYAEINNQAGDL